MLVNKIGFKLSLNHHARSAYLVADCPDYNTHSSGQKMVFAFIDIILFSCFELELLTVFDGNVP